RVRHAHIDGLSVSGCRRRGSADALRARADLGAARLAHRSLHAARRLFRAAGGRARPPSRRAPHGGGQSRAHGRRRSRHRRRPRLPAREVGLALRGGLAWGCFNASLVAVIAFGPGLLMARGVALGDAGFIVSLAIWLTMLSVPLGGLLTDRLGRPNLVIVAGSLVAALVTMLLPVLTHPLLAFCLVGLAIGAPPGAVMALLPKTVAS